MSGKLPGHFAPGMKVPGNERARERKSPGGEKAVNPD